MLLLEAASTCPLVPNPGERFDRCAVRESGGASLTARCRESEKRGCGSLSRPAPGSDRPDPASPWCRGSRRKGWGRSEHRGVDRGWPPGRETEGLSTLCRACPVLY